MDRSSKKMGSSSEAASAVAPAPMPSPKLGTAHGERESSYASRTSFARKSNQPDEIIRIRYDSHANLVALGVIPTPRPDSRPDAPNPFPGSANGFAPDPPVRY